MLTKKHTVFLESAALVSLGGTVLFLPISMSPYQIFHGIFLGLSLLLFLNSERKAEFKTVFVALLGAYLLFNFISLTQTEYLQPSLRGITKVVRQALFCLSVFFILDTEKKFRWIFHWWILIGFIVCLDAFTQKWAGFELFRGRVMTPFIHGVGRVTGPFHHANDFAAYLTILFFLFVAMAFRPVSEVGKPAATFYFLGKIAVGVCIWSTYSRGAWLAVLVSFISFVLYVRDKWAMAFLCVFLAAVVLFPSPMLKMRLGSFLEKGGGTLSERVALSQESFRMIRRSPWLGLGVNTYARNEPHFKGGNPAIDNQYAHNGYLQMATEIGLVGLVSFLGFLGYVFIKVLSAIRGSRDTPLGAALLGLMFGSLAFLLHSATDTNLHSTALVNMLWLAIGMAWAARRLILLKKIEAGS